MSGTDMTITTEKIKQAVTYKLPNGTRERMSKAFDREKIHIIKCGQKINVYDAIQEANQDTDIYKTLEKYGSIDSMYDYNREKIQMEFDDYISLMDLQDKKIAADNMWLGLPAGVREKFQNNKEKFLQEGQKWLQDLADAEMQKQQEMQKKLQGVKNNEQGQNN